LQMPENETLKNQIKALLIESLMLNFEPDGIGDETPLFTPEGLALDSIDALELSVAIEKKFGVAISSAEVAQRAFASINALTAFIAQESAPHSSRAA